MSLEDIFLPLSYLDGKARCHCGGKLTTTPNFEDDPRVTWGTCQSCGDGGVLQLVGVDPSSVPLWKPKGK